MDGDSDYFCRYWRLHYFSLVLCGAVHTAAAIHGDRACQWLLFALHLTPSSVRLSMIRIRIHTGTCRVQPLARVTCRLSLT
jgi:hypothetical protein